MAHSLTRIGRHLECAIQAEMVVELELALIERKQSRRFGHNTNIVGCSREGAYTYGHEPEHVFSPADTHDTRTTK